ERRAMAVPPVVGGDGAGDAGVVGAECPGHGAELAPADHAPADLGDEALLEILRRVPALVPVPPLFEALGVIGVRRTIHRDHRLVISGREATQLSLRRGLHGPGQSTRAKAQANVNW